MEDQNHKVSSLLTMKFLLQELYRNTLASSFMEGIIILQFLLKAKKLQVDTSRKGWIIFWPFTKWCWSWKAAKTLSYHENVFEMHLWPVENDPLIHFYSQKLLAYRNRK